LEECSPAHLAKRAIRHDLIAQQVWNGVAEKLACALMNCCWLLNPEAIIIGGGVARAGTVLFVPLEQALQRQLSTPFKESLRILPARFGNEAGIIGAATLALEEAGYNVDD
jgi:glucokinase